MTLRVSVSMQKGGVGKTTTSFNLAGALAARGHDVLAVDADPQGGLTLKLGYQEEYRVAEYALYDVLADFGELSLDDLDRLVVEGAEFDVVPSHLRNFRLEKDLYGQARGVEVLRLALDRMDDGYDYVIIDSPPNLGPLADGALIAAEHVLFPSKPNTIAEHALRILFDEIDTLEDRFTERVDGDLKKQYDIATVGAVLNQVPAHGSVAKGVRDWFNDTFGEDYVFEVPDWDAIEHAIEYERSVYAYDPEDAGYPWDADKVERLRERYDIIADHVEGYV